MPRSDSAGPGALDGSRLPRADRPDPKRPDSLAVAHAGGRRADQAREPEAPTFRMAARHWLVPRRAAGGLRATVAGGDGAPPSRAHAPRPRSRRRGRRAGVPDGQSGTVTVVQRFGSGLELNVHFLVAPLLRDQASARGGEVAAATGAPPEGARAGSRFTPPPLPRRISLPCGAARGSWLGGSSAGAPEARRRDEA